MAADFLIIANPVSGPRSKPRVAAEVCECLKARGATVQLALTTKRGDARRLAEEAAENGVKTVVGCGGDGTLQEIVCALENTPATLGIIPRGRCNDFARALGLHLKTSPKQLAGILLAGKTRLVDLGGVGGRRFLSVATLGFDSEVSRYVETHKLWVKGTAAYLYGVLRVLASHRPPLVRLRGDFGTYEGRVLLAATGNTPFYGGAMHIAPGARLDDGLFHLCVVDNVSTFTVLKMLPKVMKGAHGDHPAVKIYTTSFVEIETPEASQWICADGESLLQTPCRFEIHRAVLRVIVE